MVGWPPREPHTSPPGRMAPPRGSRSGGERCPGVGCCCSDWHGVWTPVPPPGWDPDSFGTACDVPLMTFVQPKRLSLRQAACKAPVSHALQEGVRCVPRARSRNTRGQWLNSLPAAGDSVSPLGVQLVGGFVLRAFRALCVVCSRRLSETRASGPVLGSCTYDTCEESRHTIH